MDLSIDRYTVLVYNLLNFCLFTCSVILYMIERLASAGFTFLNFNSHAAVMAPLGVIIPRRTFTAWSVDFLILVCCARFFQSAREFHWNGNFYLVHTPIVHVQEPWDIWIKWKTTATTSYSAHVFLFLHISSVHIYNLTIFSESETKQTHSVENILTVFILLQTWVAHIFGFHCD